MRSASAMVLKRWAIIRLLRPLKASARASCSRASVASSTLAVASSRISRRGSKARARARAEQLALAAGKVLPPSFKGVFPYDFGFIPSTRAQDGDPVDVLVLMDEPAFPGCVLSCRPIGVIEGERINGKDRERNDRIVAVERDAHSWAKVTTIGDLGKHFCRELEEFFINYHKLIGKEYRVLDIKGPTAARKLIKSGRR